MAGTDSGRDGRQTDTQLVYRFTRGKVCAQISKCAERCVIAPAATTTYLPATPDYVTPPRKHTYIDNHRTDRR